MHTDMSILTPKKTTKKAFEYLNTTVDKKGLRKLLSKVYDHYGAARTGTLANMLKDLGFKYATLAGVTISIEDLSVPDEKKALLAEAEADIEKSMERYRRGEITEVERYTKVIDTWSQTTEDLTKQVIDNFNRLNPVYMMAFSGARGNISQVRQLVGMRGLMADSQGQIIDMPIKSNFKEGLSVTEYIISSYGARKGLVDTALKTADSGYLTRRLVDVAQDVIISEEDCGTTNGVSMQAVIEGERELVALEDRIVSRTSAQDVVNPDGEVLVQAGEVISPDAADKIAAAGIKEIMVRSALTCSTPFGVCRKCYGWSLTTNKLVDIGEAIGIMAAQSIGEPGTQLTMRTFHTGGAVSGSTSTKEYIVTKADGQLAKEVPVRDFRTRHGDVIKVSTRDFTIEVTAKSGTDKYSIPAGTTLFFYESGAKVKKGDVLAEFDPAAVRGGGRRLTERATKDINSSVGGEVRFEGFEADEKRDRQGNITRTANRGGTIWQLSGDVYNLPAGAKHLIKDGEEVSKGSILAEAILTSEHGGEVRIPESLVTEKVGKIENIVGGKELTIIIASIEAKNADLVNTKKERLWKTKGKKAGGETFVIKAPPDTTVENGSIIAELLDESLMTPTSGEIRYHDVEVDEQRIITKPGTVYFIPEEVHQVSKDISLKIPGIESGQYVTAGTEVIKGVVARTDGVLEIAEENDIIREVTIRPGELFRLDDITQLNVDDGIVVEPGTKVAPKIVAKERSLVTVNFQMDDPADGSDLEDMDTSELEYAEIILRPVQEFFVEPRQTQIEFNSTESDKMTIMPISQLQYNDGDRVRHIEGAQLVRTSLVLQMQAHLERLKAQVEVAGDDDAGELKIVVLENLTIRRESADDALQLNEMTQTQLLVSHGQVIKPKTPVVKTQVLASTDGTVSLGNAEENKDIRRLLLITSKNLHNVTVSGKADVKKDDYVKADQLLDGKHATPVSGQIVAVTKSGVTVREGRPYLISTGAQLHVENRALTQRGDLLSTLVFERQKTGDIVQGLPRVEELLEGRKPKEISILAHRSGKVEVVAEEDILKLYITSEDGREEIELPVGSNIIVEDAQQVQAGDALTDGSINPHELLELQGLVAVRQYLVDEVQRVYRSQGVDIADKHVEVIVRQMSRKVRIEESGDTHLLIGEMVDQKQLDEANNQLEKGQLPAEGKPVLLGITKASLNTESFISAASFQETTRVLTEAAVEGKKDYLRGLKENVIIGRLIPAGTGFPNFKDERQDMEAEAVTGSRSNARKPSAILEEIESMFGAPEITPETMSELILDDGSFQVTDFSEDAQDDLDDE